MNVSLLLLSISKPVVELAIPRSLLRGLPLEKGD